MSPSLAVNRRQTSSLAPLFFVLVSLLGLPSLSAADEGLVVYSGRAERLIQPVLDAFQARTGIPVRVLTGSSTALVNRLQFEGARSQADVFISNEVGTLEYAHEQHLLRPVTMKEIERAIPSAFRASDNSWIGLSGRIWIVVYNTKLVQPDQVQSILDLANPRWKGKLAIPNAGSEYLQAGVSVIRALKGQQATEQFLKGIKANAGTFVFGKNRQIVKAVAQGEVALGIVNHYYIFRHLAKHPQAPIAPLLTDQEPDGMGIIMNSSGMGITAHAPHVAEARRLMQFLVSQAGQKLFADLNKEYPLHPEVAADSVLPDRKSFHVAQVPLTRLGELREPIMTVIEDIGLR